jgi:hypothetical protein
VAGVLAVVELDDFAYLFWFHDEASCLQFLSNGIHEYLVLGLLQFDAWEEILEEGVEQMGVFLDELG